MLLCIKQHIKAKFEAPFMKKLSNTGAEKKKVLLIKKECNQFHATGSFLYPLKTLENLCSYNVFKE